MAIKQILVVKDCPICDGKDGGCYDCGGLGEVKEWIDFRYALMEIEDHTMKCLRERKVISEYET